MVKLVSGLLGRFQQISNRQKALLAVFMLLVSGYALYSFHFSPQFERLQLLRMERAEVQGLIKDARGKGWDNISDLQKQVEDYRSQIDALYAQVLPVRDTPLLIVDMYALTTEYGLYAGDGLTFGELENREGYAVVPMELKVFGRSEDIFGFLNSVENYKRLLGIREMKLEAVTPGLMESSLKIDAYVLGEIAPDPEHYPFMVFEPVSGEPHRVFHPGGRVSDSRPQTPAGYPPDAGLLPNSDGISNAGGTGFLPEPPILK
ncbi:MAG: type 4a pilus biogenesis protein PilO [Firmicutes bacterium]|nr:type 4a pilus biogenesis protein PilO [Bacillota bacterium]MBU4554706.1 type 4a pilus biogenesis protein PilO [Bacillota bacterium]